MKSLSRSRKRYRSHHSPYRHAYRSHSRPYSVKRSHKRSPMSRCRQSPKYERCVHYVKNRNRFSKVYYNPWAVCTKTVCK